MNTLEVNKRVIEHCRALSRTDVAGDVSDRVTDSTSAATSKSPFPEPLLNRSSFLLHNHNASPFLSLSRSIFLCFFAAGHTT